MRPFADCVRNLTGIRTRGDSPQTRAPSATFALRNWEFATDRPRSSRREFFAQDAKQV